MKAIVYLNIFLTKRESNTPMVKAADQFSNFNDKIKNKVNTCKIIECTILEARKSLKFLNFFS